MLNFRQKYVLIVLTALLFFPQSCKKTALPNEKEGEIIYAITYLENDIEKFSTDLLPKKLTIFFKNDNTAMEIDGFFGLFNICNVINVKKKTNITYLNVLDKKFYYEGKFNEPAAGFGMIPKLNIRPGKHNKEICGYSAREAYVILPGKSVPIPVYYTTDIPIKNPNRATPYSDINGVLLEFYLHLSKLKIKLNATEIYFKDVDEKYFATRKGYIKVSKQQLEDILNKLME